MGGMKIWSALILLALVGMVQAEIPTTLNQSVTPASGTTYTAVKPTFICGYYVNGTPVTGATVYFLVDTTNYSATYSSATGDYRYSGVTLSAGTHTWRCAVASKPGYQTQFGSTMNYVVKSTGGGGGGGCSGRGCYLISETPITPFSTTWTLAVVIIAIIGLGVGYFVIRSALFTAATKKTKKK